MALGLCALTLWFLGVVQASELRYRDDLSFEHTAPETPSLPPLNTPRPSPKAERQAVQTLATQIIHRRAPQAATTTQPAKLWLNGVITDRFPSYICGVRSYSLSNGISSAHVMPNSSILKIVQISRILFIAVLPHRALS